MHDRSKQSRGGLVPLYALGAIFFVPLVIGDEQMDEALNVLESAIASVCDQKGAVAQLV